MKKLNQKKKKEKKLLLLKLIIECKNWLVISDGESTQKKNNAHNSRNIPVNKCLPTTSRIMLMVGV